MAFRIAIRVASFLLVSALAVGQQPWMPVGPDGGDVRTLTLDPHSANRVLLSTSAGMIFESQDGGANWSRLARVGDRDDYVIDAVTFHPIRPNVLYAGAWSVEDNYAGDVLKSLDGGKTWKRSREMHGQSVRALAIAPSDPDVLVAGTLSGVFRSNDGGEHWSLISPPDHPDIRNVESIAIDPTNPEVIYVGTWHLPWKTYDGGMSWKSIKNGLIDDSDIFSIIIDPHSPEVIYLSACSGIYKSENGGELFKKVQGIPYSSRRTRVLMQDPTRPEVVYAGTTEGLWRTVDAGQAWTRLTGANLIINDILIDPIDGKRIMLATDRGGVLASSDSGRQFFASNRGFAHRQVSTLLADAHEANTIYAGVLNDKEFGGVFVSRDDGLQWQQMSSGLEGADVYTLQQDAEGTLYAGTNHGVLRYGATAGSYRWTPLQISASAQAIGKGNAGKVVKPSLTSFRVNDLEVTSPLWLAAGMNGIFTSDDRGKTWLSSPTSGLTDFIAVRRRGDEVIAVARRGLLVSHDGGTNWTAPPLPPVSVLTDAALDDSGHMYFSAREGVYRSSDDGLTWQRLHRAPIINLNAVVWDGNGERLLISSNHSSDIFESRDTGEHWRPLPVGWKVRSLRLSGSRVFATTQFDGIVVQPQIRSEQRASAISAAGGAQD